MMYEIQQKNILITIIIIYSFFTVKHYVNIFPSDSDRVDDMIHEIQEKKDIDEQILLFIVIIAIKIT